jgi:aspartate/methionine/tyrosine aminotransferase
METFRPFEMERWQSLHENRVACNLSESGVHPLTLRELLELAGDDDVLDAGIGYGQSNGSDELRHRITSLYNEDDGAPAGAAHTGATHTAAARDDGVVVTNGSAEANYLAFQELVRRDDDVVILVPTYMQTYGLAENAGARVVTVPLREEHGWQPDPDDIGSAVTDRTRVIVVTNPGNPTGAVLHGEVLDAVVDAAARTGAWILADEVYAGAETAGPRTPSLLGRHERVIATGSLSKAWGLPGLRIGWAATDTAMAERIWARSDYTTISTGELTDRLACLALAPHVRPRLLQRARDIIREGATLVEAWRRQDGRFHWRPGDAGAIGLLRYDADVPSDVLAERLRTEAGVLVVPGTHFRLDRYIRVGTGIQPHVLRDGLDRITRTLDRCGAAAG